MNARFMHYSLTLVTESSLFGALIMRDATMKVVLALGHVCNPSWTSFFTHRKLNVAEGANSDAWIVRIVSDHWISMAASLEA